MADKIMLLDGHSLLNRAFYGLAGFDRMPRESILNAVLGFLNIMLRYVEGGEANASSCGI